MFRLEKMELAQLSAVLAIESVTHPLGCAWNRVAFLSELSAEWSRCFVLKDLASGEIFGYITARFFESEGQITNLSVAAERRGKRLGQVLLHHILELSVIEQLSVISLEVRESNSPALALYSRYHFDALGRRLNYYSDNRETALILQNQQNVKVRSLALGEEERRLGINFGLSFERVSREVKLVSRAEL